MPILCIWGEEDKEEEKLGNVNKRMGMEAILPELKNPNFVLGKVVNFSLPQFPTLKWWW